MLLYKSATSTLFSLLILFLCVGCDQSPITQTITQNSDVTGRELALTSKHLFLFLRDDKFGYINERGEIVMPAQFSGADDFSEGLAGVRLNGKYGMIDRTGKIVIKPIYKYIRPFENGQAEFVSIHNNYGLIDRTGKIIKAASSDRNPYTTPVPVMKQFIKPQFDSAAEEFHEGLAWVLIHDKFGSNHKLGYIDKQVCD